MSASVQQPTDFEGVKSRLEEIADAVSNEEMPLDEALDLFEEAVGLGLKVSDFIEEGIIVDEDALAPEQDAVSADTDESEQDAPTTAPETASL